MKSKMALAVLLLTVGVGVALGFPPPGEISITITNDTDHDVRIKSVGYYNGEPGHEEALYRGDYNDGQSRTISGFYKGPRVFVAWKRSDGTLLASGESNPDSNGDTARLIKYDDQYRWVFSYADPGQ